MAGNLSPRGRLVLVADNLILRSRVVEGARALGYEVAVVATVDELQAELRASPPSALVLDLQADSAPWREVVIAAREDGGDRLPILAYGRHTGAYVLRAARAAGCDLAVPRSRLVENFPQLIESVTTGTGRRGSGAAV